MEPAERRLVRLPGNPLVTMTMTNNPTPETDPPAPPNAGRPSPDRGWLERGSSGSTADFAVEGAPTPDERSPDAPAFKAAAPLDPDEKFDQLADKVADVQKP